MTGKRLILAGGGELRHPLTETWGKIAKGDVVTIANPHGMSKALKLLGVWRFNGVKLDENGDVEYVSVYPCKVRNPNRTGMRAIDPARVKRAPKSKQDHEW